VPAGRRLNRLVTQGTSAIDDLFLNLRKKKLGIEVVGTRVTNGLNAIEEAPHLVERRSPARLVLNVSQLIES
jgi:hypothetical protein